jgi:hypothetical protein
VLDVHHKNAPGRMGRTPKGTTMLTRKSRGGTPTSGKGTNGKAVIHEEEKVTKIKAEVLDSFDSSDDSEEERDMEEEDDDDESVNESKSNSLKGLKKQNKYSSSEDSEDSSDDDVVIAKGNKGKGAKKSNPNDANERKMAKKVGRPTKEKAGLKKLPVKTKKNVTEKKGSTTAEGRKQSTKVQKGKKSSSLETKVVVDEIKDLASFGIIPAATPTGQGLNQGNTNTSALRVVILNGCNDHCDILLRSEATGQGNVNSSWCEKLISDAIKEPNSWASKLNISPQTFNWYDRDILQVNRNGYPIRLFHIPVSAASTDLSRDSLTELMNHICRMVTNTPRNTEVLSFDESSASWIEGNVVWSDVVGTTKALSMLRYAKGPPREGFFEENEDFILTFFKRSNYDVMRQLFATAETESGDD